MAEGLRRGLTGRRPPGLPIPSVTIAAATVCAEYEARALPLPAKITVWFQAEEFLGVLGRVLRSPLHRRASVACSRPGHTSSC